MAVIGWFPLMLIQELTPTQCAEILQRNDVGRLGCSKEGQPYVVPISFSFDRERSCVYSFSKVGQKVSWMRENPRVCLEVDDIQDKDHWQTVIIVGRYEEIQDSPKRRRHDSAPKRYSINALNGGFLPPRRSERANPTPSSSTAFRSTRSVEGVPGEMSVR